jgi:hypothetical protein
MDKINININSDDNELNDFLFCYDEFGSRPNKIVVYNYYKNNILTDILNKLDYNEFNIFTEMIPGETNIINDKILVKLSENIYLSYIALDVENNDSIINDITFYYKSLDDYSSIDDFLNKLSPALVYPEDLQEETSNSLFNTFTLTQDGLISEPIDFDVDEDIKLFYNKKTFSNVNKLIKKIKNSNKGLSIFTGERGTGKSNMVKYMVNKCGKNIFYISNNLIEYTINSPEFKTFLNNHTNVLLVLDDCETYLNSYTNPVTNNILQMVDGLLSDKYNVNILLIYNGECYNDDLLDCNNLLDTINFEYLDKNEGSKLSKHIKSDLEIKNKYKLSDILFKRINKNSNKITLD